MRRRRVPRCEYLRGDLHDCGAVAHQALSVRHVAGGTWDVWPVCGEHVEALRADLRGLFVVVGPYLVNDAAGRAAAEQAAA